ncbi:hypothetical protein VTP01DRAFT_1465 [Rhizomucor pusillus]|uniref:uncharacterized protein n=1 Tax=Rhizomucor pusillus TaxID=4840 RepID=UPI003742769D
MQTCICLFNYANFIKVTVSWRISPKSVLQFPDNGSEELHVKLHYGPVSQDTGQQIVYNLLQERGYSRLADTLKDSLKEIQKFVS